MSISHTDLEPLDPDPQHTPPSRRAARLLVVRGFVGCIVVGFLSLGIAFVYAFVYAFFARSPTNWYYFSAVLAMFLLIPLIRNCQLVFEGRRLQGHSMPRAVFDCTLLLVAALASAALIGMVILWIWF